jgi:16S rRNA (guanine966-N2)-methyltransferase
MAKRPLRPDSSRPRDVGGDAAQPSDVRIIGGDFRGRKLLYGGQLRTRPMKDRVREAVFNLVGTAVKGQHAVDLFAGTGALGLEALSRGAASATFFEQHFPTADVLRQNARLLGVEDRCVIVPGNTFLWIQRGFESYGRPWLIFCSPPYDFYVDRLQDMLQLVTALWQSAPPGSVCVVESDERFNPDLLPVATWDVRFYAPARVAITHKAEG